MTEQEHRKLDAAVAWQVMGWSRPDEIDGWYDSGGRWVAPHHWAPSDDIAAAWDVVGRLRAEGWASVEVQAWYPNRNVCKIMLGPDEGWRIVEAEAPTAPEAICRAALEWAKRKAER